MSEHDHDDFGLVAIVGMALRVPGATNLEQFWDKLKHGVESTTFFSDAELRAVGVTAAELADPDYVKACGKLEGAALFDAAFFDLTPREAEILDPQHRQLLECGWEALEHAGYAPGSAAMQAVQESGRVGVFAGVGLNGYLIHQLVNRHDLIETLGGWQITLANDKDFAATRLAYKHDLRGPAANVSTACSTSLVAVGMGCQSLLAYQCDMILAGGCSIHLPQDRGYRYHSGGTLSPDGKCRAFDAQAQGTFDANGAAVLVLKRLDDARRDGDTVHAVVRGCAINNDGAGKVGYTAPSVGGQAAVIREAQEMAAVDATTIGYVETHGTGTDLGDLVEVAALTEAFRHAGAGVGWCGIGSLKSNLGHLDTAAGAASLIKTVLGLQHGQIPPTLHFTAPNPKLELETSPFYVNAALRDWPRLGGAPRRAGVSSFGIGGTNAHVVVEEAPPAAASAPGRPWQLLPLSARGADALEEGAQRLAAHLHHSTDAFADMAYSLQTGRAPFARRRAVVARSAAEAAQALTTERAPRVFNGSALDHAPAVVFFFPGQDSQFPGMAQTLYRDEPLFRAAVDACAAHLRERHGIDLMPRLFSPGGDADPAYATDPLPLFVLEHSLAQVWLALGVQPAAMLGYSLGEYACAVLAGVMSRDDALALAVAGSRLLSLVKPGALLAVSLPESELRPLLEPGLEIAMVMAPRQCVVGGTVEAVQALERRLVAQGAACLSSQLGLPFHTAHMDAFLAPYREEVRKVKLSAPRLPYVSCVSGDWITAAEATDPEHYLQLGREAVHLAQGLEKVFALPAVQAGGLLLEVGPSQTITSLVYLQAQRPPELSALATLCDPRFQSAEAAESAFPTALARLWSAGVDIRWSALYANETRRRVPLPTYAFEHRSYWVEAAPQAAALPPPSAGKLTNAEQWFHAPLWQERPALAAGDATGEWLLVGGGEIGNELATRLCAAGASVEHLAALPTDWAALLDARIAAGRRPARIVHLGLFDCADTDAAQLDAGFHSLIALGRAVGARWFAEALRIDLVAPRLFALGASVPAPAAAAAMGPLRVLPQEIPNLRCRAIDIEVPAQSWRRARLLDALCAELTTGEKNAVALRGTQRWVESFVPHLPAESSALPLRPGGVYLITGGLGNIGLALAKRIAQRAPGARLLLTGRAGLPSDLSRDDALQAARRAASAEIAKLGAEVRIIAADVTDVDAMATLLDVTEREWGPVNGVIHAAGLVGQASFATVAESTPEFCARQIGPKLGGARVLEQVLGDRPLDFCLLCSSLSPILGGLGFAAYAAANAALDACAAAHNLTHPVRWLTVNWEGWRFDAAPAAGAGAAVEELGLTAEEGAAAFERIFAMPNLERIVLSTADLGQRIRQWVQMDAAPSAVPSAARHARPSLMGAYLAPAGATQQTIATLWEQLLGIDGIGAEDSFFELGGNSLLLTQLLAQIRKRFRVELSLAALFERPTITAIAALVDAASGTGQEDREEGEL